MPGGVLFSIYPEESDEDRGTDVPDAPSSSSQDDPSLTVNTNVLTAALPGDDPSPKSPDWMPPLDTDADAEPFTQLRETLLDNDRGSTENIQRLLELGIRRLGMDGGYLNRIDSTEGVHETIAVAGMHSDDASAARDLSVTYCRRVVAEGKALAVEHAEEQGWLGDPAYEKFGFSTYLGAQVRAGGDVSGTVCFASNQPREIPFDDAEATFLAVLARAIGQLLEQSSRDESAFLILG